MDNIVCKTALPPWEVYLTLASGVGDGNLVTTLSGKVVNINVKSNSMFTTEVDVPYRLMSRVSRTGGYIAVSDDVSNELIYLSASYEELGRYKVEGDDIKMIALAVDGDNDIAYIASPATLYSVELDTGRVGRAVSLVQGTVKGMTIYDGVLYVLSVRGEVHCISVMSPDANVMREYPVTSPYCIIGGINIIRSGRGSRAYMLGRSYTGQTCIIDVAMNISSHSPFSRAINGYNRCSVVEEPCRCFKENCTLDGGWIEPESGSKEAERTLIIEIKQSNKAT